MKQIEFILQVERTRARNRPGSWVDKKNSLPLLAPLEGSVCRRLFFLMQKTILSKDESGRIVTVETDPAAELAFHIEAAGFGTYHTFFRKLVKRIAELP